MLIILRIISPAVGPVYSQDGRVATKFLLGVCDLIGNFFFHCVLNVTALIPLLKSTHNDLPPKGLRETWLCVQIPLATAPTSQVNKTHIYSP